MLLIHLLSFMYHVLIPNNADEAHAARNIVDKWPLKWKKRSIVEQILRLGQDAAHPRLSFLIYKKG